MTDHDRHLVDAEELAMTARLRNLAAAALPGPLAEPPDLTQLAAESGLLDVAIDTVDTPVGQLVLGATEAGLVTCSYDDRDAVAARLASAVSPRVLRAPARLDPIRRQLDEYFAGRRTGFTGPVDLRLASDFGRQVLGLLGTIGYGHTTTYGALATALGRPTAARAVGHALGANPVCVIVPCHRVVGADGRLTGYAGGVAAKRTLLELERA
ncbi:MAG: methylated-DNA--[protein]-cysteine S-methyltransferase [Sporichthyaceae bacterium]|nr:methylated-DNA--[protein]-cysteine S-methyltransferase [Sporichthyaceae bacterium]